MAKHTHACPECGDVEACLVPHLCVEAKTTGVKVLCEDCARAKIAKSMARGKPTTMVGARNIVMVSE